MAAPLVPKYDRLLGAVRESDLAGFFTLGDSGVLTIRMQTTGGYVYDMSVDDTGHWVYTLVSAPTTGLQFLYGGYLPI